MLTPSLNTVMTRLLIVAAVLATLMFVAPAIFAQEQADGEIIEYTENGTDPVRTFASSDPEGAGIDWDVTGHDADSFSIDSRGVLMFNKSPNYESAGDKGYRLNNDADFCDFYQDGSITLTDNSPQDGTCPTIDDNDGRERGPNNKYDITIRATERSGETNRALSTEKHFTVVVMDANEGGSITLNWLQPEVGTEITAILKDTDSVMDLDTTDGQDLTPTVNWEWSISSVTNPQANIEGHWTSVETPISTTTSTYIPLGDCVDNTIDANAPDAHDKGCNGPKASASARDEGKYLRVKATYIDRLSNGNNRTAIAVSANPVRAEVSSDRDNVENPDNGSPGFTAGLDYTRSVPESTANDMPVGDPVVAVDPNDDTLTYELKPTTTVNDPDTDDVDEAADAASDVSHFKINKATGQISVAKTLDYDSNPDEDNPDGKYKFVVMATDPSGETAMVEVTVTATADNDAPKIMGSLTSAQYTANDAAETAGTAIPNKTPAAPPELRVDEKDDDDLMPKDGKPDYTGGPDMNVTSRLGDKNVFIASDEDARGQIFWDLRGDDADDFVVSSTGIDLTGFTGPDEPIAVRFKDAPDYENPTDSNADSVYKVTLVARDSAGAEDTRALTVFVDGVNEAGEATLSTEQPLIGQAVTAEVSDPDNSVTVVTWRWERATSTQDGVTWKPIPGATTATYVPWKKGDDDADDIEDDDSMFLRATATYIDTTSDTDKGSTGMVDERVQMGTDDDPMAKTASTTKTGIATVTVNNATVDMKLYRVMVTSANAVRVAEPTVSDTPAFPGAPYERMVAENSQTGALVGLPVMADYDDPVMYSINNIDANDNMNFEIDPYSGQIRVGSRGVPSPTPALQLPLPTGIVGLDSGDDPAATTDPNLDYESKDTYTLVITAADRKNAGKKATATVMVSLINQNEGPYFDKESRQKVETVEATAGTVTLEPATIPIEYAENRRTAAVALAAIEPDGNNLRWELTGPDAADFMIEDIVDGSGTRDRVELVFKKQPDFEDLKGSATTTVAKDTYVVTVRATEMTAVGGGPARAADLDVRVKVTNVNEGGSVAIKWLQPEVGTALPATLSDVDGPHADATGDSITPHSWQWYRAKVANPNSSPDIATLGEDDSEWEEIDGASSEASGASDDVITYTPIGTDDPKTPAKEGDGNEGWHLLVRVEYDDAASADNEDDQDIVATEANEDMDRVAIGMTANPVRADVANEDNNSPDFQASKTTRTIDENTPVGDPVGRPVMVQINEDNDTLTYELVTQCKDDTDTECDSTQVSTTGDGNDAVIPDDLKYFRIDNATGQIYVKKGLSYEEDGVANGEYTVVVRATDPSGEGDDENRDDIVVKIVATDVNEAPKVGGPGQAELSVDEVDSTRKKYYVGLGNVDADGDYSTNNTDKNATTTNLYQREEQDLVDSTSWPEPIGGPDGALFEYSVPADARGIGRRLHFISPPDFENPMDANRDNVYEVTIMVVDTAGLTGEKNIRITVNNVNEKGKLALSPDQPHMGGTVMATLTDPDCDPNCGVTITDWDWYATTTASSTPSAFEFDAASAMATSSVGINTTDSYMITDPRDEGLVGKFIWVMVEYRDGSSIVNDPVTLLDERNDMPNTDTDQQIETRYNSDEMQAKGTVGAVQEDPAGPDPSAFPDATIRLEVPESLPSTGYVGMPVLTYDPTKSEKKQDPRVNVGGPDGALFTLAEDMDRPDDDYYDSKLAQAGTTEDPDKLDKFGQLALKAVNSFNYESAKNTYTVEVMDEDAASELGVIMVIITVTDVNEYPSAPKQHFGPAPSLNTAPEFAATSTTRMVAENTAAGTAIGDPVEAMDADRGDTLSYELGGADAASFAIDSETGQLMTSAALDYETMMEYMVTVTATDSDGETDMIYVTIMVTNEGLDNAYDMDDSGKIEIGEAITAVQDFFAGRSSLADAIAAVQLYFAGLAG